MDYNQLARALNYNRTSTGFNTLGDVGDKINDRLIKHLKAVSGIDSQLLEIALENNPVSWPLKGNPEKHKEGVKS